MNAGAIYVCSHGQIFSRTGFCADWQPATRTATKQKKTTRTREKTARRRERMEERERKTEEGNKRLEHALFKAGRRH